MSAVTAFPNNSTIHHSTAQHTITCGAEWGELIQAGVIAYVQAAAAIVSVIALVLIIKVIWVVSFAQDTVEEVLVGYF